MRAMKLDTNYTFTSKKSALIKATSAYIIMGKRSDAEKFST
jgi:hypothetical protein